MSTKKIGVSGCGMIAELGHSPALKHVSGINLHAVYWHSAGGRRLSSENPGGVCLLRNGILSECGNASDEFREAGWELG